MGVHTLKIFRSHTFGFGFHRNFFKKHINMNNEDKIKQYQKKQEVVQRCRVKAKKRLETVFRKLKNQNKKIIN